MAHDCWTADDDQSGMCRSIQVDKPSAEALPEAYPHHPIVPATRTIPFHQKNKIKTKRNTKKP